jgi:putative ABC transport system ATP-binding protein
MNNIIKIENISKIFQNGDSQIIAVKDISFTVPEGQFLTITGKSGSGKSTLLYQMGLLDSPTHGKIFIDGHDVLELDERERGFMRLTMLGYIFQDYAILPTLTALENVLVPLIMLGYSSEVADKKAKRALERMGLLDRMHNLPSQLSGGQQQRVSIARAIAHDPKIIFADEPTANLDSETSENVLKAFLELNKDGQTIVMVTHEIEYAKMSHRTLVLADGVLKDDFMNK